MGHEFHGVNEVTVEATPEEVWAAIATGPGIDSWFMGNNDVAPGETVRMAFGQYTPTHAVTAWQPGREFAYRSETEPDGRYIAYEFLIEGREQGSTVLRMTASGFLPGDDWADEYEAMTKGGELFFQTLVTYLTHFVGRTGTPVTVFGPMIDDWPTTRAALLDALGSPAAIGDRVHGELAGLPPIDGVLYFANDDTVGVRTEDAIYRFLRGLHGPVVAAHVVFGSHDPHRTELGWQSWLDKTFA